VPLAKLARIKLALAHRHRALALSARSLARATLVHSALTSLAPLARTQTHLASSFAPLCSRCACCAPFVTQFCASCIFTRVAHLARCAPFYLARRRIERVRDAVLRLARVLVIIARLPRAASHNARAYAFLDAHAASSLLRCWASLVERLRDTYAFASRRVSTSRRLRGVDAASTLAGALCFASCGILRVDLALVPLKRARCDQTRGALMAALRAPRHFLATRLQVRCTISTPVAHRDCLCAFRYQTSLRRNIGTRVANITASKHLSVRRYCTRSTTRSNTSATFSSGITLNTLRLPLSSTRRHARHRLSCCGPVLARVCAASRVVTRCAPRAYRYARCDAHPRLRATNALTSCGRASCAAALSRWRDICCVIARALSTAHAIILSYGLPLYHAAILALRAARHHGDATR